MARKPTARARTPRSLLGLDRSGPEPVQTRAGEPLRPFTVPNLIEYVRLILIAVFLVIALESHNGRDWVAAVVFFVAAATDYLDGFIARLTGQYSRMGALLDPIVDRALIVSGMLVCWKFHLLPRWAIALVVLRELVMLGLSRYGLRRGVDIEINWVARLGVWPTMAAPVFAMLGAHTLALVLMLIGLVMTWSATVLYVRHGIAALRELSSST